MFGSTRSTSYKNWIGEVPLKNPGFVDEVRKKNIIDTVNKIEMVTVQAILWRSKLKKLIIAIKITNLEANSFFGLTRQNK